MELTCVPEDPAQYKTLMIQVLSFPQEKSKVSVGRGPGACSQKSQLFRLLF